MGYCTLPLLHDDLCMVASLFNFVSLSFIETQACLFSRSQCLVFLTPASSVPLNLAIKTFPPANTCTGVSDSLDNVSDVDRNFGACIRSLRWASSPDLAARQNSHIAHPPATRTGFKMQVVCAEPTTYICVAILIVALRMEVCKQHLSLHSESFNAKTLGLVKTLYFVLFGARRLMSIVLRTSSRLAWTHRAALMTSEKVWR